VSRLADVDLVFFDSIDMSADRERQVLPFVDVSPPLLRAPTEEVEPYRLPRREFPQGAYKVDSPPARLAPTSLTACGRFVSTALAIADYDAEGAEEAPCRVEWVASPAEVDAAQVLSQLESGHCRVHVGFTQTEIMPR
jgi:hypothetical protein